MSALRKNSILTVKIKYMGHIELVIRQFVDHITTRGCYVVVGDCLMLLSNKLQALAMFSSPCCCMAAILLCNPVVHCFVVL